MSNKQRQKYFHRSTVIAAPFFFRCFFSSCTMNGEPAEAEENSGLNKHLIHPNKGMQQKPSAKKK